MCICMDNELVVVEKMIGISFGLRELAFALGWIRIQNEASAR